MPYEMEKKTFVIGLTGGIGAGKSTITEYLLEQGIPVFDCDAYVKQLYQDADFVATLTEKFGELGEDPKATMADKVVKDPDLLDQLTPLFDSSMQQAINSFCQQGSKNHTRPFVVIDAPVLFEHGLQSRCNVVVTVSVPEAIRRVRTMDRPGMNPMKFKLITDKQWTDEQREAASQFTIHNTGTKEQARESMAGILSAIQGTIDVTV
jgi:dephospho-CoA kinase